MKTKTKPKTKRRKLNTKLLRKIRNRILARPRQFLMSRYYSKVTDIGKKPSHCGTAACIAGWAVALHKNINPAQASEEYINDFSSMWIKATKLIGLENRHAAASLFTSHNWPRNFYYAYITALSNRNHAQAARVAADRINHLIRTGK